jgi:hypothetical protein
LQTVNAASPGFVPYLRFKINQENQEKTNLRALAPSWLNHPNHPKQAKLQSHSKKLRLVKNTKPATYKKD